MIFRSLDSNGDWTFGSGRNSYKSGDEEILLNISTRLKSWANDCFFAQDEGIDWLTRLGTKNQQDLLELDIRSIILQTDGVTELVSFSVNINEQTRKFTAEYNILTVNSQSYTRRFEQEI